MNNIYTYAFINSLDLHLDGRQHKAIDKVM